MISIRLFGKLSVSLEDGTLISISGSKSQGLIAYLALNTEMPPSRDRLMALFWGDRYSEQARQSLRQAIAKLKKNMSAGGDNIILTENDHVGLNPDAVVVDVDEFTKLSEDLSPAATAQAVSLLTAPVLDDLYGQQADFEDWMVSERQRLLTLSLKVLERAVEQDLRNGDTGSAINLARRIVALDPLRDAGQVVLIRILAQQGERAAAIRQFNAYEATLKKELGVGAGPELVKLIGEIKGEQFFVDVDQPTTIAAANSATNSAEGRTSVAVVPFGSLGGDPKEAFLVEGLTEDITTNLSRFSWLDVRASIAGGGLRLTNTQMSEIGRDQGLDYIVHGSLRSLGTQVRLTVQLAEPTSGRYLWVSRYDRNSEDPFALQDELAETIAASVEAEIERLIGRSTRATVLEDMNAWKCYHRGLAIQYEFSAETNQKAQKHFERAIELDPNFGLAYARLSYALVISAIYFEAEDVPELMDRSLELAINAARLEPEDAVARFALGRVHLARGEYDRSIQNLRIAIELNPGMAQAHCGLGDSMAYSGQLDDAIGCFEEAVRISPSDPYRWAFLSYGATAFLFKGDFEAAEKWASMAESVPNSHYWPSAIRASALGHLGELEKAGEAITHLKKLRPGIDSTFVRERLFYLKDQSQIDTYVSGLEKAGLA
ncbi:putative PEP-CTERM system TPR-repeat lipoprotein [Roseibium album]|nr:putative PEP-CTERM system TPR-repeat lipoprotein [Roseibium album]